MGIGNILPLRIISAIVLSFFLWTFCLFESAVTRWRRVPVDSFLASESAFLTHCNIRIPDFWLCFSDKMLCIFP